MTSYLVCTCHPQVLSSLSSKQRCPSACLPPYHPVPAMTSSWSVIISCLLLASQGLADMDNNQQIMEMMSKMKAAMIFEVEERVETKLRAEMKEKEEVMRENVEKGEVMREVMKEEMQEKVDVITKEMRVEMDENDNRVKKQLDRLEARNTELTTKLREVDQKSLRDLPYVLTCAFQEVWTIVNIQPTPV